MSLLKYVNVSSGSVSFGGEEYNLINPWRGVISAYSISKLALNGLTLKAAPDLKNDGILVNAATPGVTATYEVLANFDGRPVSEGAKSIVFAATLPKGGGQVNFSRMAISSAGNLALKYSTGLVLLIWMPQV
ncbi:MAG TPA: SDR family NAD(P)-dependent oxidoreductase [Mucilaginibacter sp.]|nr:SDR family NAD(P)-dependent oxidoreductase [Mucilaginibacter sp.]